MNVVIQPKHMSQNTGNIMGLVHHIKLTNLTHGTQKETFFFCQCSTSLLCKALGHSQSVMLQEEFLLSQKAL